MKKWKIGMPDPQLVSNLQRGSDLSALCCNVLVSQGCTSIEQANERFGCHALSDPSRLCDMQKAADAILAAMDAGKHICIYGDYDCDGIMSTVILCSFLSEIGADVSWRIPERAEGYGLNRAAVQEMHEAGVELIVTVDNGISAIEEAAFIRELGMELVVTDHHQPGAVLPEALAVVDAHREDNYSPFRLYCGAGIALLLVAALNDGDVTMALEQFGDLAAIATVADVVPLIGENRYLVQMGLQYLENSERPGIRALREITRLNQHELSAADIAFYLSPRINAAGRVASPRLAVELLLAEDYPTALSLAQQLEQCNNERKSGCEEILRQIRLRIDSEPQLLHERVLLFDGEGWNPGIIGIAAARMQELHGKPSIIISRKNGIGVGSMRSFGDFSAFACLTYCGDLLEKFGGHPGAGGFTVRDENLPAFRERVAAYAAQQHPVMPVMELSSACVLRREVLNVASIRSLAALEPFGAENPEPLFVAENARIMDIRPLSGGAHTKLAVEVDGVPCEALLFQTSPESTGLHKGDVCHLMVQVSVNTWNGTDTISLQIKDRRTSGISQSRMLAAIDTYDRYRRQEPLPPAYYQAITPSRADCIAVYQNVPPDGIRIEWLALLLYGQNINYCKMRICLDIFAELGIIEISGGETFAKRLPGVQADLGNSRILQSITERAKEG